MKVLVLVAISFLSGVGSFAFALCSSGWEVVESGKAVCQKIEESGPGYYRREERFTYREDILKAKPMQREYRLFEGSFAGRAGAGSSACGLGVFANYLYGLKYNIKAFEQFLNDWTQAAPALILYALATYLPVAKEALLGIEMISNAVASLRGFTCERAMQMIKQMNYTDSILIENCVKNKLCSNDEYCSDSDYDRARETNPEKWFRYYNECLNSPNLFDVIPTGVKKWFAEKLNYRKNLYCVFWGDRPYSEVIADLPDAWSMGGIKERAKILAFALTPSFEFSTGVGRERAKIQIGALEVVPGNPSDVRQLVDKMMKEDLSKDINDLVGQTLRAYQTCFSAGVTSSACSTAMSNLATAIDNFENKWNVEIDNILEEIDKLAQLQAFLERRIRDGDTLLAKRAAEYIAKRYDFLSKKIQYQVYLEVRRALIQQFNQLIATATAQKNLGSSAGCGSSSSSSSGSSGSGGSSS